MVVNSEVLILFDVEGVLVSGRPYWKQLPPSFLQRLIPHWNEELQATLFGRSLPEVYTTLCMEHGLRISRDEFLRFYEPVVEEIYGRLAEPLPGLEECLYRLNAAGYALAVVSSLPRSWFDRALMRLNVRHFFPVMIGLEEVEWEAKPSPRCYVEACKRFCIHPQRTLAVEDSPQGISSALAAGVRGVCVIDPEAVRGKEKSDPRERRCIEMRSLNELTPALVMSFFRSETNLTSRDTHGER